MGISQRIRLRRSSAVWVMGAAMAAFPVAASAQVAAEGGTEPVPAQSTARTGQDAGLEDIVVMAQRRSQSLQEVPLSVVAIGPSDLKRSFAMDLRSLDASIPNANIERSQLTPTNSGFSMRGVGVTSSESFADPSVATYVNGVYKARSATALSSTLDVEAIEVLRGPQGTLYGRNALSGAISVRTTRPDMNETSGSARATIGNYNLATGDLIVNLPVVEDQVAARVAIRYSRQDGYYKNNGIIDAAGTVDPTLKGESIADEQFYMIRPSLRFTPGNGDLDITFFGEIFRNRGDAAGARNVTYNPRTPSNANCGPVTVENSGTPGIGFTCDISTAELRGYAGITDPFGDSEAGIRGDGSDPFSIGHSDVGKPSNLNEYVLTNDTSYRTSAGTIRAILNYSEANARFWADTDGLNINLFSTDIYQDYKTYSGELQFISDFSEKVDIIAGVFYFWDRYKNAQVTYNTGLTGFNPYIGEFDGLTPSPPLSYGVSTGKRKTWAAYAQIEYKLTDPLSVVLGGRYSWEKKYDLVGMPIIPLDRSGVPVGTDFSQFVFGDNPDTIFGPQAKSWKSFSPRVGVNYKVNDDVFLFAFWQRAFKSGGFNMNTAAREVFDNPFGQERVDSYEAGVKSELFDRRLRFNAQFYYSFFKGLQRSTIQPNASGTAPQTVTDNAADQVSYGLELEVSARPVESLTLYTNVGLNKAYHKKFCTDLDGPELTPEPQSGQAVCGAITELVTPAGVRYLVDVDNSDLDPVRAPKVDFSAGFIKDFSLDSGSTISMTGNVSHTSKQAVLIQGGPRAYRRALTTVDGSIAWIADGDRYRVTLWGRNLFDQVDRQGIAGVGNTFAFEAPTQPRTFGLTFDANF